MLVIDPHPQTLTNMSCPDDLAFEGPLEVLTLLVILEYKSAKIDARPQTLTNTSCRAAEKSETKRNFPPLFLAFFSPDESRGGGPGVGAQFTCVTSTKVRILARILAGQGGEGEGEGGEECWGACVCVCLCVCVCVCVHKYVYYRGAV